jgi:DNA ligase (NAD+)
MSSKTDKDVVKIINLIKKDFIKNTQNISKTDLVKVLKKLSDVYYNTGETLVDDNIYDKLHDILKERDPKNKFLSTVGAPVGTKEKKKLPFPMGSLNKYKPDSDDVEKWAAKYEGDNVVSDKLDGASVEIHKNLKGKFMMYSRGDGEFGTDISHIIGYFFDEDTIEKYPLDMCVRGEMIITKKDFKKILKIYPNLKNARNTVAGLVNQKNVKKEIAKKTKFITYAILNPRYEQSKQMKIMTKMGFDVVEHVIMKKINNKILEKYLLKRKEESNFDIDGIVVVNDSKVYKHKGGYPSHAFAFKVMFDDQKGISKVVDVLWSPSKDGYIKPRIQMEPLELVGVTVTYATAKNARFLVKHKLGPGAVIEVIRSGDVIPDIIRVLKPATSGEAKMPDYPYKWNESKADILLKNPGGVENRIVVIKLLSWFFKTMEVKYLSDGILTKLVDEGYDTIAKILEADQDDLFEIDGLGETSITKIYKGIDKAFKKADLVTFMNASHKFGRGLGGRKLYEILDVYPNIINEKWKKEKMIDKILEVHGFSNKTATKFAENFDSFKKFYDEISKIKDISRYKKVKKKVNTHKQIFEKKIIVFTGFRDNLLKEFILKSGGKVSDSVSGNTTILVHSEDIDESNNKYKKAKSVGTKMMTKSEFIDHYKIIL